MRIRRRGELQPRPAAADVEAMDATAYAFTYGVRRTRETLCVWQAHPGRVLARWLAGSALAAGSLLAAVWIIASLSGGYDQVVELHSPFAVGNLDNVVSVLGHNMLVLALHAMACVAGFIAGSSLPMQAEGRSGVSRWVHEHGGRLAIGFVVAATTFSLSAQAYVLGHTLGGVSTFLRVSPGILLLGVLPHAVPELIALFLPLAAWIIASRRGEWEQLLAATFVTLAVAVPLLVVAAFIEVYVSPHLFTTLTHIHPPITRYWEGWTVTVR
jgi:stage II sporulation SpoM-like protein